MFEGKDPVSGYTERKTYGEVTGRSRQGGCGTGFYVALLLILPFFHTSNELCKASVPRRSGSSHIRRGFWRIVLAL